MITIELRRLFYLAYSSFLEDLSRFFFNDFCLFFFFTFFQDFLSDSESATWRQQHWKQTNWLKWVEWIEIDMTERIKFQCTIE